MATRTSGLRGTLNEFGELTASSASALKAVPGSFRYFSEIMRQTRILIVGSSGVIAIMLFLIGFTQTNFGYYFLRAAGAADFTGLVSGIATPRVTGGIMFGYIFAAKVGCGLTSEIGAMKINEELDALESEAVSARRYIVATRVAAAMIFAPFVAGLALVADTAGSYINAIPVLHALPSSAFFRYHWGIQALPDQIFAFVTLMIVAMLITLVACFYGQRTKGGPAAVGESVSRSLVVNLVLVHIVTGVLAFLVYGTDPKLPIGG